jgi:predicted ATPase
MLEVHRRIHAHKKQLLQQFGRDIHLNLSSERDSILIIAKEIAQEARVLCFDEFQVTDICDAMILSRLFGELWRRGVVLVATSNRHPEQLYLNGLNRQYFLPFIANLEINCVVRNIGVDKDYRQDNQRAEGAYYIPNSQETREKLWAQYTAQLAGQPSLQETIPVMMGRSLTLPAANLARGACFVSFAELCETDRGSADYQALCAHFRCVYMHGIPTLTVLVHNEARRLIMLVDAMYNSGTRFVWTAAAPPADIFRVLTAEEMPREKDAALGTDHAWSDPADLQSYDKSHSGATQQGESRHLRGGQQSEVKIPLDSNVYFGSTLKFAQSEQLQDAAGQSGAEVEQSTPADAAQDELKVLEGELASVQELGFAFRRASSRLVEMSSVAYLQRWFSMHLDK